MANSIAGDAGAARLLLSFRGRPLAGYPVDLDTNFMDNHEIPEPMGNCFYREIHEIREAGQSLPSLNL